MKVALVYDRVNKVGGAERVLLALHEIFPDAPLYTAVYNPETASWAQDFQIKTSFLQNFPWAKTHHEFYPWLTPLAFESFDFSEFDVVISVTSAEAKGIITKPKTLHVCYCLTPTRYLWSGEKDYPIPFWAKPIVTKLRIWDQVAGQRPDVYLAISENVSKRIQKYYHRQSEVIYPGIETEKWQMASDKGKRGDFFLVVSRLVPYKRIDIVIEAFNRLELPLKVVGVGSEAERLQESAKSNIEFLGQLTDQELLGYYQSCKALIFPTEEDFGLTPLEAQSCGRPVIAFGGGGALETIVEGKTGEFFKDQTKESLISLLKNFKPEKYQTRDCRENALRFTKEVFKKKFKEKILREWKNFQN